MSERQAILLAEQAGDVAALRLAIGADDASVRILALGSLARLDSLHTTDLDAALNDDDRDVRCRAIELSVTKDCVPVGATQSEPDGLLRFLDDADDLVVETAAWALGERFAETHTNTALTDIVEALSAVAYRHDESICREAAIAALGSIGSIEGLPAILAGMQDKATVRRRAVLALAPFSGEAVDSALERALHDRDRQVRQAAEDLRGI